MLIRSQFDIQFHMPSPAAMVTVLHLHPSLGPRLRSGDELRVEHLAPPMQADVSKGQYPNEAVATTDYLDAFGNRCSRFIAPAGHLKLSGVNVIEADDQPDTLYPDAQQAAIEDLPSEVLQYLLPSRYCEVDRFGAIAQDLFASVPAGWQRATAIRDWAHRKVTFNYNAARPTKTAMDVFIERTGVCRDFQHLAITLSRCQNIPARYVTGYIGDIRRPWSGPGDFSAWYQVFLDGKWIDLDARHNYPRLGRILMATGRDAADVAITTSFGAAQLTYFYVESEEIDANGNVVPKAGENDPLATASNANSAGTPTQTNAKDATPSQMQTGTN